MPVLPKETWWCEDELVTECESFWETMELLFGKQHGKALKNLIPSSLRGNILNLGELTEQHKGSFSLGSIPGQDYEGLHRSTSRPGHRIQRAFLGLHRNLRLHWKLELGLSVEVVLLHPEREQSCVEVTE